MKKVCVSIAIILILLCISIPSYANQATVVNDGEDVIQVTDGTIYVGQGVTFNGEWITLFNVRFPALPDGGKVGAATFPSDKVKIIYHKGAIGQQQPTSSDKAINTW